MNELVKKGFPWAISLAFSAVALWLLSVAGQHEDEVIAVKMALAQTQNELKEAKMENERLQILLRNLEKRYSGVTNEFQQSQERHNGTKPKSEAMQDTNALQKLNGTKIADWPPLRGTN